MTNPSREPEKQRPQKWASHHSAEGDLHGSGEGAKIMHEEIQKALKMLRGGSDSTPSDTSRVKGEG